MRTFKVEFNIDVDDKNYPNAVSDLTKAVDENLMDLSSVNGVKTIVLKTKEIQKAKYKQKVKHDVKG